MTFYGKILTIAQGKDDLILVMIWNTIWIQEFLKGFFMIALISKTGAVGAWLRHVLSKCVFGSKEHFDLRVAVL